jgi:bifunctional DNA-binding transcriptional regulator/antitoxin component of YhaV-PrlF toxin-antitoxin module
MHRFTATIEKAGSATNAWCFVTVPTEIVRALGTARRITGTIADHPFEGALIARAAGVKRVLVTRDVREALQIGPGQRIEVVVAPDRRPREVTLPPELATALECHPAVASAFSALAPSHQREYADWIAQAKKPETKAARIERALTMIAQKRHVK